MTGSDDEAWIEDDVSLLPLEHAVEHRLTLTPTARAAQNVVTDMDAGASRRFIFFLLRSHLRAFAAVTENDAVRLDEAMQVAYHIGHVATSRAFGIARAIA